MLACASLFASFCALSLVNGATLWCQGVVGPDVMVVCLGSPTVRLGHHTKMKVLSYSRQKYTQTVLEVNTAVAQYNSNSGQQQMSCGLLQKETV